MQDWQKRPAVAAAVIGLFAFLVRTINIGGFSLWVDEVLQVRRARAALPALWGGMQPFPEHPPFSAALMRIGYVLQFSDDQQRYLTVVVGLITIGLLTLWVRRGFGSQTALIVAGVAALSPFHLRYSQELRPYVFLLFFGLLALLLTEEVLDKGRIRQKILLGITIAGGLYSHALFPVALVPVAVVAAFRTSPSRLSKARDLSQSLLIGLVLFAPWIPIMIRESAQADSGTGQTWTLANLGRRFEFLAVAGVEGTDFSWAGALYLVFLMVGIWAALQKKSAQSLAVLAGAVFGSVGVEAVFHYVLDRWTVGRYDILAWPFLTVLVGLGARSMLAVLPRLLCPLVLVVLVCIHVPGLSTYYERGREHWDRLAEVIDDVRRPGELVMTENIFCQLPLEHYLPELQSRLVPLRRDPSTLLQRWPDDGSFLLVRGGAPQQPRIRELSSFFPMIVEYSKSQWLYRFPPRREIEFLDGGGIVMRRTANEKWPEPSIDTHSLRLGRCGRRPARITQLEFEPVSTAANLHSGWSGWETTGNGVDFVWAVGAESGVKFCTQVQRNAELRLRLWPFSVPTESQRVRLVFNGTIVGTYELRAGPQEIAAHVDEPLIRQGPNLLVLQFAYAVPPAAISESGDRRPLACAVDWIRFGDLAGQEAAR